jgi:hypothetical protein
MISEKNKKDEERRLKELQKELEREKIEEELE